MSNESIDKILAELQRVEMMLLYFQRTGKIPDIEREIVLSKLRNIYEFLLLIQLHKGEQIEKPLAQPEKSVEEPATSQIDKDPEGSGKFTDVIKLNTLDEPIEFSDEYSESPMAGSPAKDLPVSVTNPEINS